MKKGGRKKVKKNVQSGIAHVQSTFNNTMITITDVAGNGLCWSTAGSHGFKGSRKSTPFAAQVAAEECAKKAMDNGIRQLGVAPALFQCTSRYPTPAQPARSSCVRSCASFGSVGTVSPCRPRA